LAVRGFAGGGCRCRGLRSTSHEEKGFRRVPESGFREIIEVLRRHGGEAPQHVIVEETGLSKASVSMMLKALEASGVVVRVKSGKTKVVRLVR
jgi:Mn-dependent DtxR family transcriptional regulator